MKWYVGTSGWKNRAWKGSFYKEKDYLGTYGKNFNTVEVPDTFYLTPSDDEFKAWKKSVPKNFEFTLRAPMAITHKKRFYDISDELSQFYKDGRNLGNKMGFYLFQAPPDFEANDSTIGRIKKFLRKMDRRRNNVIEFTHESWWQKDVFDMFKKRKIMFCSAHGMGLPTKIVITDKTGFVHMHEQKYSKRVMKSLIKKLEKLKCKQAYIHFISDRFLGKPFNALNLKKLLK